MTKLIIYFCTLLLWLCRIGFAQTEQNPSYYLDTILEENSATNLNMQQHQLYIDTLLSKKYINTLQGLVLKGVSNQYIESELKLLTSVHKINKIDFKTMPTFWIRLRKYNGQFYLYDRCNGSDQILEIRDSAIIIYGPLENNVFLCHKLLSTNSNKFQIEVFDNYHPEHEILKLEFNPIKNKVYTLSCNQIFINSIYVTPIENIASYKVIRNHCPLMMVPEYPNFE